VIGIAGVRVLDTGVSEGNIVAVGKSCAVGVIVHTGVGDAKVSLPQADDKNIKTKDLTRNPSHYQSLRT
jgi:hypothetical protein